MKLSMKIWKYEKSLITVLGIQRFNIFLEEFTVALEIFKICCWNRTNVQMLVIVHHRTTAAECLQKYHIKG